MTDEKFFKLVKGKRIRWKGWIRNNDFFIPLELAGVGLMGGTFFSDGSSPSEEYFWIVGGFTDWEFTEGVQPRALVFKPGRL